MGNQYNQLYLISSGNSLGKLVEEKHVRWTSFCFPYALF